MAKQYLFHIIKLSDRKGNTIYRTEIMMKPTGGKTSRVGTKNSKSLGEAKAFANQQKKKITSRGVDPKNVRIHTSL